MLHRFGVSLTVALCVALGVTLCAPPAAQAQEKPTVAVLGLEVIDDGGGQADAALNFAAALTAGLRQRASLGKGAYQLAPNSSKDLLEMKLLGGCADEGRECMAAIGEGLRSSYLMYGKVESNGEGYQVSLKLLNVKTQAIERTLSDIIPLDEASGEPLKNWSRKIYNRMTGIPDEGSIRVQANVDGGTIYLDGEPRTTLSAGAAKLTGLPEGEYTLAVESEGYQRYAGKVAVSGGETTQVSVQLARTVGGPASPGTTDRGRPGGGYRAAFWTSVVLTGAGVAGMTVSGLQVRGALNDKQDHFDEFHNEVGDTALTAYDRKSNGDYQDVCKIADDFKASNDTAAKLASDCDSGRSNATLFNVSMGTSVAFALAATYFYYKGYAAPGASESAESAQPTVRIQPTLGPNIVGAGVEIEF